MTLQDAMALQPVWVGIWLNILLVGAFVAPLLLLLWKSSRKAGNVILLSSVIAVFCVQYMFDVIGDVELLGLPHLVF
jgi:predicted ABC-type sugar transport system permease subunit